MTSPSVTSKHWRPEMYTYTVETVDQLTAITTRLLRYGIGFRASYDNNEAHWVIELTGAH